MKITLVDGDVRYLMSAEAEAADQLLMLSVYPRDLATVPNALVEGPRGANGTSRVTPDVLVVEPSRIAKVELLYEPPEGRRGVGFQAPVDDVGSGD